MNTSLPLEQIQDSAARTKLFFDTYGDQPLEFSATEVDACTTFFLKNGFDESASLTISAVLLKQAKIENIPIFRILDTLKQSGGLQLSALVAEILNNNRTIYSTLGYRQPMSATSISRNIHA